MFHFFYQVLGPSQRYLIKGSETQYNDIFPSFVTPSENRLKIDETNETNYPSNDSIKTFHHHHPNRR